MLDASFIEFKLDYSGTKDLPIGKVVVHDDGILAGGRTWEVGTQPRGVSGGNGEYLALYAGTMAKSRNVVNRSLPCLRDGSRRGAGVAAPCEQVEAVRYGCGGQGIAGWPEFMKRSDLESGCLVDGRVTFVCGIIVADKNRVPVPASDMGSHLGRLLDCADGADVSFSVGGEAFRSHRAVLAARSPVFKAQLLGSMADATMPTITLHDIGPETFRNLLRFIYTDALPADNELEGSSATATELLQHLLAAADMYALDRLKLACAQREGVSADTVAAILCCAETHNCPELKKRCIDFFVVEKNFRSAVLTEGYLRLMQSFPSVIDEIRARVVQT